MRGEPPITQLNTLPGFGDHREGRRQLLTLNEITFISSNIVNKARLGYNRIHIAFAANNALNSAAYGIDTGVDTRIGVPQIIIAGGGAGGELDFGGINGFPQRRGDHSAAASDTLSWTRGTHMIRFGGEYRRIEIWSPRPNRRRPSTIFRKLHRKRQVGPRFSSD